MGSQIHDKEGRVMLIEYRNMFIVNVGVPSISTGFKRLDYRTKH